MLVSGILSRYFFKELMAPFGLALLVFSSIALMARIIDLMDLVINKGFEPGQAALLVLYLLPSLLVYTVPMAAVLAVLIALGRMSADAEIIALKASGVSLYQMLPPFAALCLAGFVFTALCTLWLEPLGRQTFRSHIADVSTQHIAASLESGVFNDSIDGLVIYVQDFDPETLQIKNIMISDRRDPAQPAVIVARRGIVLSDQNNLQLLFRLYEGSIHRQADAQKYEYAVFTAYQIRLLLDDKNATGKPKLRQSDMNTRSLFIQMRERKALGFAYARELTEINRRLAIPFACLVFGLLGLSVGVYLRRGGRASGFMISLIIVVLYYLMLNVGEELSRKTFLHPVAGMWLPNALMGSVAVYLFYTTVKEKPYPLTVLYTKKIAPGIERAFNYCFSKINQG